MTMVPACGSNTNSNSGGGASTNTSPAGASGTVLADDFSAGFPGTNWVVGTTGKGSITLDPAAGNPSPSVQMTGMALSDSAQAVATTPILKGPFTATMEFAVQTAGEGSGGFDILDATSTPIAAMEWHPIVIGAAVTFMLHPTTSPNPEFFGIAAPTPGPAFHSFQLMVDATGMASWNIDGKAAAMSSPGFPAGPYTIRFYTHILAPTGPFARFLVDNVKVTSP
jgi:hypothetical protein